MHNTEKTLSKCINSILKQSRVSPFLSIGLQSINYQTTLNEDKLDRASSFALPIGGGLILDVSERIKMDIGMHYTVSFADIDQSIEMLNYKPTTDIKDGIPKFIDWYKNYHK